MEYNQHRGKESYRSKDFLRFSDFAPFSGKDNYYQRNTGRDPLFMEEGTSDRFINGDYEKMTPRARKNINLLENINAGYAVGSILGIMVGEIAVLAMLALGLEK